MVNKTTTTFMAAILLLTAAPSLAEEPEPTVAVGDVLAFQEPILLPTPNSAYIPNNYDFAYFAIASQNNGEGVNGIDGFVVELDPNVAEFSALNDCPQIGNLCSIAGLLPDIDVFFYTRHVDEAGEFTSWEAAEGACTTEGEEEACATVPGATHAYVTNWAGAPTFVTVTVTKVATPLPNPCDLPEDAIVEPSQELPQGGQHATWNSIAPLCNHLAANSWCADNDWPSRATPGPNGPPGEGAAGDLPSRCNENPCSTATPEQYGDAEHVCYQPNRQAVEPPEPRDPQDIAQDVIDDASNTDPAEAAQDAAHAALNGTAARWVREFTPARCDATGTDAPYGCDDYWQ